MGNQRFKSLDEAMSRKPLEIKIHSPKASEFFGMNVFNKRFMAEYLPSDVYDRLVNSMENGHRIEMQDADAIASGMKNWALANGATHYTHWFQPLTGTTAEKHDSFFHISGDGSPVEKFASSALIQQEPDASSFPSGGLRNTFEARGYTGWDPSSPAFLYEFPSGKTLCIPTIFVSYTGESLDFKSPLLKSLDLIEKAGVEVCNLFDKSVTKVFPTLGIEQEYFLVDAAMFRARPDLVMSGRTLFGHTPAKGQQLEDHYFGSIPHRVISFMVEMEQECWKLGIPLKTRHNEVALNQFECAPLFEGINLAIDHNQLMMDVMQKIAEKHNFAVILHEKPFKGLNGSGKHNNWSLGTNTGKNLLSPGKTPKSNLQFLTFFVNTIKAFHDGADLIRGSIASASNDHRLGANEAPPAIMSAFLGSQLDSVLNAIENSGIDQEEDATKSIMKTGISQIPEMMLDNTDRNRTSPFAFTGNKFELRAVGSSANSAFPMTIMNTLVGLQLMEFKKEVEQLMGDGKTRDQAILSILKRYIVESKRIRFEGNGYGEEWVEEAARRGLNNIKTTPRALDVFAESHWLEKFEKAGVFSKSELHARHEIMLEQYSRKVQIEGRIMEELALSNVIPAVVRYQNELIENVKGQKSLGIEDDYLQPSIDLIKRISKHIAKTKESVSEMNQARKEANQLSDAREMAIAYCEQVIPSFETIRYHIDKLEMLTDDSAWPLPKYRELLFIR